MAKEDVSEWLALVASLSFLLPGSAMGNEQPVADAGADITTHPGIVVVLDGSGSSDADGHPIFFLWSVLDAPAGITIAIDDPTRVRPAFVLPAPGSYSFQLIVNDGSMSSVPDSVTVTTMNSAPVARAGVDQSASVGARVALDGTASSDVDGDPLTYEWTLIEKPERSNATLLNSDPASPLADFIVDQAGRYVAQLIVRDLESSSVADATIVSTDNSAPKADAGHDRSAAVGEWIDVSGGSSSDADDDALSYRWSLMKPADSAATLTSTAGAGTRFMPDVPGSYVVQLIVNDGERDSEPDTMAVSTDNSRPYASAYVAGGGAYVGSGVGLNGYYSYDPDDEPLTYSWSVLSAPVGSTAAISDSDLPYAILNPDLPGIYVVQLIVSDGTWASDPATVQFEAIIWTAPEPVIYVDPLPEMVNVTPLVVGGSVSEPVTLWLNNNEVPLDSDNRFEYALSLVEGYNDVELYAIDGEGYSAYYYSSVILDTQPPAAPVLGRISVQAQAGQRLIVTGNDHAVEQQALVRIINLRTGETVEVQAGYSGRFVAELGGIESDELSIVAQDTAENVSYPTVVPGIGSGPLRVEIVAPLDGASVASSSLLVNGALYGPVDAGVSVNGQPAVVLESGWARTFSALVPLQPGNSIIVATATRPNGATATAQLQVTSNVATAFRVAATPFRRAGATERDFCDQRVR